MISWSLQVLTVTCVAKLPPTNDVAALKSRRTNALGSGILYFTKEALMG